jgi:hypothetical protein
MAIKPRKKKPPKRRKQTGVPDNNSKPEILRQNNKKPPKKKRSPNSNPVEVSEEEFIGTDYSRGNWHRQMSQKEHSNDTDGNEVKSEPVEDSRDQVKEKKKDDAESVSVFNFEIIFDEDALPAEDEDGNVTFYETKYPDIHEDCYGRHYNKNFEPLFYRYEDEQRICTSIGECWSYEGERLPNSDNHLVVSWPDENEKKTNESESDPDESLALSKVTDACPALENSKDITQAESGSILRETDLADGEDTKQATNVSSDIVLFSEDEIRKFFSTKKVNGKGSKSVIRSIKTAKKKLRKISLNEHDIVELNEIIFDLIAEFNGSAPQIFKNHNEDIIVVMIKNGKVVIEVMTKHKLRFFCHRLARFVIIKADGSEKNAMISFDIITDVNETPNKRLDVLERVVQYPIFDKNRVLAISPGYNPESKIFFDMAQSIALPEVSDSPSDFEVKLGRYIVDTYLFKGFQFATKADYANAFSLFLLFFVLDVVDGPTPLHVIESAEYGSGKTYLVRCIIMSIGGLLYRESTLPNSEAEIRRQLFAELLLLNTYILFENLNEHVTIDSAELAQLLTGVSKSGRLLGKSQIIYLKLKLIWMATGINVSLSKELKRRSVPITLIKPEKFPEEDRLAIVNANRDKILWAGLTICQAHFSRGGEQGRRLLPSFNRWSSLMDGILKTAGIEGFLENQEAFMNAADPEFDSQVEFVATWYRIFGTKKVLSHNLIRMANDENISIQIEGRSDVKRAVNLGFLLRRIKGRRFGHHTIKDAGMRSGSRLWRLMETT